MKNKIAALVGTFGGLCALCCVVPIAGFLGLGALEAFFCDSPWAIGMGVGLMTAGFGYLALEFLRKRKGGASSCAIGCGCGARQAA